MMNSSQRKAQLLQIKEANTPSREGIPVTYKGETQRFNAYKIDLSFLVYNPYNGRIGTSSLAFEKENHKLNPELAEDIEVIEKFLWESKPDRNQKLWIA